MIVINDLNQIREELSRLVKIVNWQTKRSLMPYDWVTYGHPEMVKLCGMLKIDLCDGHIKKQDKRGYWR